eukprot:TRINITY_DN1309_c0_g1_i1.p1 TRINITY_DN1309_c0_g1~~TRINITY_DN1309_c0_g1_i1.p1  ORF type:complete len:177 (-),score=39.26 TRINITY_DN1309_c0_g1_i1:83-562(-)
MKLATFGGGCFWGMEKFFKKEFKLDSAYVGYMGGDKKNPSYEDVCTGKTGHAEVIQLSYDPKSVQYSDLVQFFFRMHDPTTVNRQGNDRGTQYRSAIFYHDEEQKETATKVRDELQATKIQDKIVTEISPASTFYKAEAYHQQYLDNNPGGYCNHRLRW